MTAFLIWAFCGLLFICMGVYACISSKPVPFWANIQTPQIRDIKGYNRAVAKLWFFYGFFFILLGLPLFAGQNSPLILLSLLGAVFESIIMMAVYILVIDKKYIQK